ncbi:MAG: hypothetical protein ACI4Q6_01885 [Huintestinicola sp.]
MKKIIALSAAAILFSALSSKICAQNRSLPLPDVDTDFKTYMDYRTITDTSSLQYALQEKAYTDSQGIRRIGDDVCVALGTGYTEGCGERFEITLDSGKEFTVIVGDIKADCHTDSTNRYVELWEGQGDVLEFIVDTKKLDRKVRLMGSVGEYDSYKGNISSIIPIED